MGTPDDAGADTLELATRFIRAVESGDIDAISEIYAPDAVIWHNDDEVEQTVEQNLRVLSWLHHKLPSRSYTITRLEALPDGYVQQHVLEAALPDGGTWRVAACLIVRVQGGCIVRLDEYLDSARSKELLVALGYG